MIAVLGSYKRVSGVHCPENSFCELLECENV
jgi:hypothetical protein